MPPEIKIIIYLVFTISMFFINNLTIIFVIFIAMSLFLAKLPFQSLKKGFIPIILFLLFTFLSNILFEKGRVIFKAGSIVVTHEGLKIACLRTARIFFMIGGAKILTATTKTEELINALRNIFKPLEYFGVPVQKFFITMGTTIAYLPIIKNKIIENYRSEIKNGDIRDFFSRVKILSNVTMSFFIKSMESPERLNYVRKTDGKGN